MLEIDQNTVMSADAEAQCTDANFSVYDFPVCDDVTNIIVLSYNP